MTRPETRACHDAVRPNVAGVDHDALEETTLATTFQSGPFRISDLRRVYEVVWGTELDPGNFQRKVRQTPGWLADTGNDRS